MKKKMLLLAGILFLASWAHAQVVTTASSVTICSGPTTVDVPIKVSSFTAVGSITLRFSYVNAEITSPSVVYKDPGLAAWGTFAINTSTPGVIKISAYDPNTTPPVTGLTLDNNDTLFTFRFTLGTITTPSVLSFVENAQGTWCEYGGVGPDYTPFTDTPTGTYYINGSVTVVADPSAPGLTKNPAAANVCAGQTLTVSTTPGSGGTGTIADEYRYTTNNGTNWSTWSVSVPSFAAVAGNNNKIQSRRTANGTGCDESTYNEVSWNVVADPVAPGITKNPTDANVCEGQTLTVSTTSGSGGTGTIADEYRYTTNNGTNWSDWSVSVPSFAAVAGNNNKIQSRRTANGTGCDESSYNEVSWNVVADPVAPGLTKNPATASVCEGDNLTVTTSAGSGGTGTIADEYRYSTNNGDTWSSWSVSVPSFTSIAGTNKIQSRRTASGTGCGESNYNEVSWTVNAKKKISGTFNYYNSAGDILLTGADITVKLYKSIDASHSNLLATDVTDASGYFEFPSNCPECDYDIVASSTHSTDGAVNTTDAAQANYWGPNGYAIQKVRFHAGDVDGPDLFIGGTDAGRIQSNFINGTSFDTEAWTFWKTGSTILHNPLLTEPEYTEYYPKITLSAGSDAVANMYGLASGDFNRSFNPNLTKAASATLGLIWSGTLQANAGQEIDLPVRMVNAATIGAISLIFNIPADLVDVQHVMINGEGGQLAWAVKGDELRIGWLSPVPLNLSETDALLTIRLKTTQNFTPGQSIRISLAADPLNELADEMYNVIGKAQISIETIDASPTGISDRDDLAISFTCYPNPSRNFAIFSFSLPKEGTVTLDIVNLFGSKVSDVIDEVMVPGNYTVKFDTYNLPNGVYSASLKFKTRENELIRTNKLIINR